MTPWWGGSRGDGRGDGRGGGRGRQRASVAVCGGRCGEGFGGGVELRDTGLQSWTPHGGELQALSWIWSPILRCEERSRFHARDKND